MNTKSVYNRVFDQLRDIGRRSVKYACERFRMLLGVAVLAGASFVAVAQGDMPVAQTPPGFTGIGPVVSGSTSYDQIPKKARKFLEKNCDGHAIVKCERGYLSGQYEVSLADGIDMSFDVKGNLVDIEAPDGYSLSPSLLHAVVPGKLYNLLVNNGFSESVEGVVHRGKAYKLRISDPVFNRVHYDSSGVLTLVVEK